MKPPLAPRLAATAWRHLLAAVAAMLLLQFAQAASPPPPGSSRGALLYHNYCSVCHGDKGNGQSRATGSLSTPPRDFTTEASRQELTRERIVLAITHGRPGTAMVGWKSQLSESDITVLADHVLSTFVKRDPSAQASTGTPGISGTRAHGGREADTGSTPVLVDMTAGLPNGLQGDFKRGGAFYLANCAACHGARGDGAGPRAYFINPKPRNFIEPASRARFNRLALFAAVTEGRNGTEMPAWKQVATPQQIADVSEYVFRSFIAAPPAAQATAAKP